MNNGLKNRYQNPKKIKSDQAKEEEDFRIPLVHIHATTEKKLPSSPQEALPLFFPSLSGKDSKQMTQAAYWELRSSPVRGVGLIRFRISAVKGRDE